MSNDGLTKHHIKARTVHSGHECPCGKITLVGLPHFKGALYSGDDVAVERKECSDCRLMTTEIFGYEDGFRHYAMFCTECGICAPGEHADDCSQKALPYLSERSPIRKLLIRILSRGATDPIGRELVEEIKRFL